MNINNNLSPFRIQNHICILLLLVVTIFNFYTMPLFYYPGDNVAIKAEAANLVNTGRVGFSVNEQNVIHSFDSETGQYFFINNNKIFSKYGYFYSISYIPPILAKKLFTNTVGIEDFSDEMTFFFNCYNVILSTIYIVYLYKILYLLNRNRWQSILLVLICTYASFNWYYLRSPEKEILQMVPFAGAVYHMIRYLKSSDDGAPSIRHLTIAFAWGGYIYLLKPLYGLLIFVMAMITVIDLLRHRCLSSRKLFASNVHSSKVLGSMLTVILTIAGISLTHNYLRTGAFFDAGYGQDKTVPSEFIFTLSHFTKGLATYFILPGNGNWFLHQPLLVLAIAGYPSFFRKHKMSSLFLLGTVTTILVVLCFHVEWIGEWCYGPRFCINLIMMASIPVVESFPWLLSINSFTGFTSNMARVVALFIFLVVIVVSIQAQFYINSWHYHTYYYYSNYFNLENIPIQLFDSNQEAFLEIDKYFRNIPHRALLNRDLTLYRREHRKFSLLKVMDRGLFPVDMAKGAYDYTDEIINRYYWNYLLIPHLL